MTIPYKRVLLLLIGLLTLPILQIDSLRADWSRVTDLDQPVTRLSPDPRKAKLAMKAHFEAQIAANEAFLKESKESKEVKASSKDPHAYEAKVRLAVAQAKLASLDSNPPAVTEALEKLKILEKQAPDDSQHAETMFRRLSLQWQNLGDTADQRRENATTYARLFATEFPQDRRAPRLLAEAAALCDNHPEEKAKLIEQALTLSREESLTQRLQDDRKRLTQLGKPLDLSFTTTEGEQFDLSKEKGHVVALIFWSAESAPCLVWMQYFSRYAAEIPALKVVTISLDRDRTDLRSAMQSLNVTWPTFFDGKGWDNTIARRFGINTIPTLWLIDRKGCLQALNARNDYQLKISSLLQQK
ncbi:MAG: TlpA family protein disulfide reductase [Verrucomicrobia bacterium]|nr:TlpA family protein disulfide reductase [Verrucomicrobiota bacterium]